MTQITTHEQIEWVCGDTWKINGTIQDEDGLPLLLTGVQLNWKLTTMSSERNLLELTIGNGITVVDEVAGTILIEVPLDTTDSVTPGIYYDWLRITLADGRRYTEWTGPIMVLKEPAPAEVVP